MILSADTTLFLNAANPQSPHYAAARKFFERQAEGQERFLLCGPVLVEIYMQLRNPLVFAKPKAAHEAVELLQDTAQKTSVGIRGLRTSCG